ncbi:glycine--tRNA ligase subunit alpha [candidate division WOR-3 bacterium]|nr:glycine--tRNA ligase subunit alpha [candidate division WOR-3 bacterium]
MSFDRMISALGDYWSSKGCYIAHPYSGEVGAGTFNPFTFLFSLGKKPVRIAYVEISKRPKDGRYNDNPLRFQQFTQFQVLLKPSPSDVRHLYIESLDKIGIRAEDHDIRFVEDDWESPTLGASGLGWEVWIDGMEISQFTYFQQMGGIELEIVSAEMTYGLERISLFLQDKGRVQDIALSQNLRWNDVYGRSETEWCKFNFEKADIKLCSEIFEKYEKESARLITENLVFPAYDYVIKCSHLFNILDARGAISPDERAAYIARIRKLSRSAAKKFVETENQYE